MYDISFHGVTGRSVGVIPVRRPSVPAPEPRITETQIPGRDGAMIENEGIYELLEIPIEFNFLGPENQWMPVFGRAKKWLSGGGWLILDDFQTNMYKVLYTRISDTERTSRKLGKFTAEFVCDPYSYLVEGQKEKGIADAAYNEYAISHPIYKISGSGSCILTVNEKEMKATVNNNLTIDTDRMVAYNADGVNQSMMISGDYENLYLLPGGNSIEITKGFTATMIPNWREL